MVLKTDYWRSRSNIKWYTKCNKTNKQEPPISYGCLNRKKNWKHPYLSTSNLKGMMESYKRVHNHEKRNETILLECPLIMSPEMCGRRIYFLSQEVIFPFGPKRQIDCKRLYIHISVNFAVHQERFLAFLWEWINLFDDWHDQCAVLKAYDWK